MSVEISDFAARFAIEDVPNMSDEQRLEISELGKGFYTIRIRYGFMDEPNILRALAQCRAGGLRFNLTETSFIIRREKLRMRPRARRTGWWRWHNALFIFDVEQYARRDRVFLDPAEPCRRTGWSSRDLSDINEFDIKLEANIPSRSAGVAFGFG